MIEFRRTRLAPSPTGALHLGHARTFLVNWWLARQCGAQIFMRMDDLDLGRATDAAVGGAYADLKWLGMEWDRFEDGRLEVVQSSHLPLYAEALQQLWERNAIYPCTCTRADIAASVAASVGAPHETDAQIQYPGTCRANGRMYGEIRSVADAERAVLKASGKKVCWRLRVEGGEVAFTDFIASRFAIDVANDIGDFPLTRFDGTPAYQLACVVDDHAMGIDMVVRGDDLLASTPRQLVLYHALGIEKPPRFAHVPLIVGADGKRLAKRHGESRIDQFCRAGISAERLVGWVAWRSGQIAAPMEITAKECIRNFDLEKLPRKRIILGTEDFAWLKK